MGPPRLFSSFLIVLIGCMVASLPAHAEEPETSGAYLGLSGTFGIGLFGDQFESSGLKNPKLGDSAGFRIKAGYRVASWFALEAQYEWLNEFVLTADSDALYVTRKVAKFRPQTVTANLKFILPTGRIEPHVIVGLGVGLWEATRIDRDISVQKSAFAARLGAGVDFYLTQSWALNVQGTGVIGTTKFDQDDLGTSIEIDNLNYFSLGAGVTYCF